MCACVRAHMRVRMCACVYVSGVKVCVCMHACVHVCVCECVGVSCECVGA